MEQPDEHYSLVGGNLVITNPIQKKHAGTYTCVARNIYGTVLSKEARVKFGCEPLICKKIEIQPLKKFDATVPSASQRPHLHEAETHTY